MGYTTRRQYLQTGVTVAGVLGAGCLNNESSRVYEDTPPETPFEQDGKITFAVLPDTQFYSENDPEVFDIQTKWIAADWVDIDYVIHVGDLVQHWDNRREWERASSSFSILEKKTSRMELWLVIKIMESGQKARRIIRTTTSISDMRGLPTPLGTVEVVARKQTITPTTYSRVMRHRLLFYISLLKILDKFL